MSDKLFQCFIALCLVPCSKLQVPTYASCIASVDKALHVCDCMWWIGEHGGWCYFYPICSQNSSPSHVGHTHPLQLPYRLSEWRVGAAEICGDTWYLARGLYAGSLVPILQVGSSPARPSLTLQDILSRPVSLFLRAQGKPLGFQEQIWLVWGWFFFFWKCSVI